MPSRGSRSLFQSFYDNIGQTKLEDYLKGQKERTKNLTDIATGDGLDVISQAVKTKHQLVLPASDGLQYPLA